jgi:hypothetical protein
MQKVTGKSKVRECFVFTIVAHFKHRRGQKCIFNICVLKSLLTLHQIMAMNKFVLLLKKNCLDMDNQQLLLVSS